MKCIIDVSDWLSAVGLSPTLASDHRNDTEMRSHTHTHSAAGEHLWYGKLVHINLVGVDVISAWTWTCHSNDGGHWLRFIRKQNFCNNMDHISVSCVFVISTKVVVSVHVASPGFTADNHFHCNITQAEVWASGSSFPADMFFARFIDWQYRHLLCVCVCLYYVTAQTDWSLNLQELLWFLFISSCFPLLIPVCA